MPCIWNDWLPEPLATEVRTEEPRRFALLIDALTTSWFEGKASKPLGDAATASLAYIPLVRTFIYSKAEPEVSHIQKLVDTLLDIVLSCHDDLAVQARWGGLLHRLLRAHSRKLSLVVPWRPLYEMLRAQSMEPSATYEGAGVMEARRSSLVHILHRARRFFPLGSAAEIWAEFAPPLQDPSSPAAFEAVGWLCMLMPTQEALRQQGNWAEWVPQWVSLLNSVTHNQYIESLWLSLFARLIKHDVHGMVYWPAVLPELWARMLWAFQLPVGTATASPPYYGSAPSLCAALFTDELGSRSASAAKAVIYLVGRQPVGADGEDPALVELESAVALLEQYYHPSNGGKWTAGLAIFLRELTAHLCRRLVAEHYVSVDASAVPQDSDEESDEDDGDGEDSESDDGGGVDSSSTDDEVATVPAGGAAAAPAARRHLTPPTRRRLVSAIVRLASKGQSSKDRSLRRASSASLALLANVEPDLVLPIVHRHFATALDTVTAARQYGGAIQTLSLCARPLLLAGLQPESAALLEEGGGSGGGADVGMALSRSEARAAAAQSLASAMMSTLPGIDANDPPKSLAVFRLYCCILSCVGDLPEHPGSHPGALPLYTEEWAEELLSRVFSIISNLDAPDHGAEDGGQGEGLGSSEEMSFLLNGNSMFRPLMELLFVRLPLLLRAPAIRRASKFLLENTFSSVTSEAAVLCNAIAWADSAVTSESLLTPLLASLQRDAAAIGAAASSERLSKVQETSFKWRLNLLSSSGFHMGAALVPHGPAIRAVLTSLFSAPSQAVQEAAGRALSSLLVGLTAYYPKGQYAALPGRLAPTNSEETDAVHLECYIDKIGNGCEGGVSGSGGCTGGMAWHVPSPEEIDLANEFLQEFLEAPSDKLLQLCSGGAGAPSKDVVRSLMLQLEGALGGVRSCLPDFPECSAAAIPDSVAVVGRLGAVVGSPQLREKAAAALVAASHAIAPSDAETLGLCIRVMDLAVAVGSAEHAMAEGSASAWASDDRWLQEPAVAGMLLESMADELSTHSVGYGPKWRRRRPMWLAQEKVYLNLEWRASQAAYRWYASASQPAFDPAKLPKVYLEVLSRSVHFVVRGLRSVRDTAAAIVERAAKRYPRLAPALVAPVFAALAKVEDLLEFDPGRTTSDILPRLRQAAQQAPALAAAAAGETESDQDQGMVLGAATLFRGMAVWRHVTRDWAGLQSLCLALTASAAHTGIDAQTALSVCSFIFVLRFMRPPVPLGQTVVPEAAELCADAIAAATSDGRGQQPGGAPAALMPWRYAAAANSYPLMVLPCLDESAAAALMRHYASQLDSDILVTRQLAAAGISTLLLPLMLPALASKPYVAERCVSLATANAARAALAEILTARAHDLIPNLISHLANSHPALVSGGDPQGQRGGMMSLSRDDMVSKTLTATLIKGAQWPAGSQHIPAVFAGQFLPSHARAAQALCFAAPEAVLTAVRAPIEAVLGKSQDSDRPAVAAAAEALAGIVGSGAPFETGAWDEWVGAALATALANAPLDFVDLWGGAVLQYAVFELHKSGKDEAIGALVQTILRATGAANGSSATRTGAAGGGSTSGALYKRLAYLNSVLTELVCLGASGNPPKSMRTLLAVVLDELPSLTQAPGEMVRQAAAGLVADATLALLEARATPESPSDGSLVSHEELSSGNGMYGNNGNGSGPDAMDIEGDAVLLLRTNLSRLHAAARALLDKVAADLEAGTAVLYDRARSSGGHHHPAAPVLQAMSSENDADVMHAADAVVQAVVADEVRASQEAAVEAHDDADADVEVVLAPGDEEDMEGDAPGGSGEMVSGQSVEMFRAAAAAAGGADAEYETALAHVAFGVEVVVQLLASTTSAVEPWLVRMLPSLLRLQELVPSELQFVALVASKALRGAKYQPLNTKHAAEALAALRHALHAELWTERAAALAFLQYFWFRHGPVLGRQGTAQVVEEVLQRLEDSKLEVRELAAATLSGVLRGLAPEEQAALRKRCLARAADLFPGRRRRRLDGDVTAAQQAPLPERHGVVLALKAFVLSSPYDVPPWLPQVLMALVQLASEPAPVRTTVTKALSDFRRTHEETGLAEVKDQLTQEQWEAIRDVASPASYFV